MSRCLAGGVGLISGPMADTCRLSRSEAIPFVGHFLGEAQFLTYVAVAGARRQWLAVLHTFDGDGAHTETRVFRAGPESDSAASRAAGQRQQDWLRELKTMLIGPIDVLPFSVERDGETFGLLARPGGAFELVPLGVHVP